MKSIDYVELYAKHLSKNNTLFVQQKKLIESQMKGSSSLFKGMFGDNFKTGARKYLKGIGLI